MAIMVSWLCNFLVSLTFLDLCRVMTTSGAFALFASVGVVGTCAIQTSMPETMGMTLEQIELLTAINTVMYYGATIMEKAGFSESSAVWLSAGCNLAQALGVCYCVSQMDKVGRRDLALRSSKLVTIALVLLSTSFIADPPLPWLTMPLVMFYLLSFGSGLSGVPWAINSEVFPLAADANIALARALHVARTAPDILNNDEIQEALRKAIEMQEFK
eukprot:gene16067-19056_t